MDIFFEVGRTPTPSKTLVDRREETHSRFDAVYNRKPPERQVSEEKSERPDPRPEPQPDRQENDVQRSADQQGKPLDNSAETQPAEAGNENHGEAKTEEAFTSHIATVQSEAEKAPVEKLLKEVELFKAPVKPVEFVADAEKPVPVVLVKAPLTVKPVELTQAQPVTTESVEILPAMKTIKPELVKTAPIVANVKVEPVKKAAADIKPPVVKTAVTAQVTVKPAETISKAPTPILSQDLQGFPFSESGAALDLDLDLKLQLGDRLEFRPIGTATVKSAPMTFNRMPSMIEMPAAFMPQGQGELVIDPGLGGDLNPDLAALKQVSAAQALQISTTSVAVQASQAQTAAATQIVAAIKTERVGNSNTIEVRLDPPELGRVRIDLSMETADAVKAVLTAERSETLEHLRRNTGDLMEQLRQAGFTTVDLEFSSHGSSQFEQDETAASAELEADAPLQNNDMIYLSLRDDAQMDLLV